MHDDFVNYFLAAALGLACFVIPMLLARRKISQVYVMLALFLVFTACASALPIVIHALPALEPYSLAIVTPSYILQPLCLWLYVKGLCSPTPWDIKKTRPLHFVLPGLSLLYASLLLFTPVQYLRELFESNEQPLSQPAELLAIVTFGFMLSWIVQSAVYLYLIVRRLLAYRSELKQLFASNDKREMGWLFVVISGLATVWTLAFYMFVMSVLEQPNSTLTITLSVGYFILLWLISFWGLRQKPGFNQRYLQKDELESIAIFPLYEQTPAKYTRSGVDEERAQKIADKIELAMKTQSLYLNPDLSLKLLAAAITEKPNYVSQSLNQILSSSFFDYVNRYRIEHSKQLIVQNQLSMLEVAEASGFNAKSSFYKAFKANTGQTPKQFATTNGLLTE